MQDLATADADHVMHLWTGLGYYSRARNLQRSAQIVCAQYGGEFPDDVERLSELPGIGRSTAGAISAIAFGKRAAILDGNVKRVLARFHGVAGYPGETAVHKTLWDFAEAHTPDERVEDYTQAMMDLGATLCTRSKPACGLCPLQDDCIAQQSGRTARISRQKAEKNAAREKHTNAHHQRMGTATFCWKSARRPASGRACGYFRKSKRGDDPIAYCADNCSLKLQSSSTGAAIATPSATIISISSQCAAVLLKQPAAISENERQLWYNLRNPAAIGLAAPVVKLLHKLLSTTAMR